MDDMVTGRHCCVMHRKAGKRIHPASSHHKNTFSFFFFSFHCIYIRRQMLDGSIVAILSQYMQVNQHAVGLQVKNKEREKTEKGKAEAETGVTCP